MNSHLWDLTKGPSGPISSLVELIGKVFFWPEMHLFHCGRAASWNFPRCRKQLFAVFCVVPNNCWQLIIFLFFGCSWTVGCLFCGMAWEELRIPHVRWSEPITVYAACGSHTPTCTSTSVCVSSLLFYDHTALPVILQPWMITSFH